MSLERVTGGFNRCFFPFVDYDAYDSAISPYVLSSHTGRARIWTELLSTAETRVYSQLITFAILVLLLCCVLALVAYLFSLTAAQDTEKRSEYECGFAPFDSATRHPFEVHFYVVGVLFLVFDVEIALLFPWVLTVEAIGVFSYLMMFQFVYILAVGFHYE